VFTHAHVSMITYRVHVYRSRPIGASLLTTSPQQGCLALKGLHTGASRMGVVTGIRLIHIMAAATAERHGGFLVQLNVTGVQRYMRVLNNSIQRVYNRHMRRRRHLCQAAAADCQESARRHRRFCRPARRRDSIYCGHVCRQNPTLAGTNP